MNSTASSIGSAGGVERGQTPTMLGLVPDLANVVTLVGLLVGCAALLATIRGALPWALALALGAIAIDNIDGRLARRDRYRSASARTFGAHLDCYSDFVSKGIFPPLLLLVSTDFGPAYMVVAAAYICAVAIRYSYEFVPDSPSLGLSPDYVIVLLALYWLGGAAIGAFSAPLLAGLMLVMAALGVSSLRVPKLTGPWLISFFCLIAAEIALLLRL